MPDDAPILSYRTAKHWTASEFVARMAFICSTVPAAVGLLIVVGYAVSREDDIAFLGLYWLAIGGGITFIGFVASIISLIGCRGAVNELDVRWWSVLALMFSLLSVLVAAACVTAGLAMMAPRLGD